MTALADESVLAGAMQGDCDDDDDCDDGGGRCDDYDDDDSRTRRRNSSPDYVVDTDANRSC